MVKGISRRVIVVDSPDPQIFEQAIFILRTDGGGVSAQQALLIDPLAEKVRASVMHAFAEGLELKSAALQNDAGLVGAVYYFKKHHD